MTEESATVHATKLLEWIINDSKGSNKVGVHLETIHRCCTDLVQQLHKTFVIVPRENEQKMIEKCVKSLTR